jgi:hypothetical protein
MRICESLPAKRAYSRVKPSRWGREKAKAKGEAVGRPAVADKVGAELAVKLSAQGQS